MVEADTTVVFKRLLWRERQRVGKEGRERLVRPEVSEGPEVVGIVSGVGGHCESEVGGVGGQCGSEVSGVRGRCGSEGLEVCMGQRLVGVRGQCGS